MGRRRPAAELIHDNRKIPAGLIVRTDSLALRKRYMWARVQVTTSCPHGFSELGRYTARRVQAVQRLDEHSPTHRAQKLPTSRRWHGSPGVRGLKALRAVLPCRRGPSRHRRRCETGADRCGLPAPQTQFEVFGEYASSLPGLNGLRRREGRHQYDGPQHWTDPAVTAKRDIDKSSSN